MLISARPRELLKLPHQSLIKDLLLDGEIKSLSAEPGGYQFLNITWLWNDLLFVS